jgi:hypothetical protein
MGNPGNYQFPVSKKEICQNDYELVTLPFTRAFLENYRKKLNVHEGQIELIFSKRKYKLRVKAGRITYLMVPFSDNKYPGLMVNGFKHVRIEQIK